MTARAKIESLTNSWYGFAVFSAICSFLTGDSSFGFFGIGFAVVGVLFSWLFTWFLGRRLLNKSSLWRMILIVASAIMMVSGGLNAGRQALAFVHSFQLSLLVTAAYSAVAAFLNAKSLRTLMDSSVRAYFA